LKMMRSLKKWIQPLSLVLGCCLVLGGAAMAKESDNDDTSADALAKAAQNPLAALVSVPMQFNFNNGAGPYGRKLFNLNIQPVVPIQGEKWNIITRTIIPVNSVPVGETGSVFGLGDTTLSLFASPAKAGTVIWGVGPIAGLPTASNPEVLGSGKWGLGPTGVILVQAGKWTVGGLASNLWSVAGDGHRDDYNLFTAQYFVNYNFGHGWALGTAPILTADWKADSDNRWTIPWGLQVSKVTHIGSQPVNLMLGYYDNSEHPEGAATSKVIFQVNFMFPTKGK